MNEAGKQLRRERRRARRRKTVNLLPSMLTLANLMCGLLSMVRTMNGEFRAAAWFIVLAGLFDIGDGRVARLTHSESDFGKELDSLSDLVSFGVAPALLVYHFYGFSLPGVDPTTLQRLALGVLLLLPCAGAVRLARYNLGGAGTPGTFIGLPIPAAAGTLTSLVLVGIEYPAVRPVATSVAMPLTVVLSWLMVSRVRYPRSGLFRVPRPAITMYLFMFSTLVFLFTVDPSLMLLGLGTMYVSFGLLNKALRGRISLPAMRDEPDAPEDQPLAV